MDNNCSISMQDEGTLHSPGSDCDARHSAYKVLISQIAETLDCSTDVPKIVWHCDLPDKMKQESTLEVLSYLHRRQGSVFNECDVKPLIDLLENINHQELVKNKVEPYQDKYCGASISAVRQPSSTMPAGTVNPHIKLKPRPVTYYGQMSKESGNPDFPTNPCQETLSPGRGQLSIHDHNTSQSEVKRTEGNSQQDVFLSNKRVDDVFEDNETTVSTVDPNCLPYHVFQTLNSNSASNIGRPSAEIEHPYTGTYTTLQNPDEHLTGYASLHHAGNTHSYPNVLLPVTTLPESQSFQSLPLGMMYHGIHPSTQSLTHQANNAPTVRKRHSTSHYDFQHPVIQPQGQHPQRSTTAPGHSMARPQSAVGRHPSFSEQGYRGDGRQLQSVSGTFHEAPHWYNSSQDSVDHHQSYSSGFASSSEILNPSYNYSRRRSLPPKPLYFVRVDSNQHSVYSQDQSQVSLPTYNAHYDNSNSRSSAEYHSANGGHQEYVRMGQSRNLLHGQSSPTMGHFHEHPALVPGTVRSKIPRDRHKEDFQEDIDPNQYSEQIHKRRNGSTIDRGGSSSPYSTIPEHRAYDQAPQHASDFHHHKVSSTNNPNQTHHENSEKFDSTPGNKHYSECLNPQRESADPEIVYPREQLKPESTAYHQGAYDPPFEDAITEAKYPSSIARNTWSDEPFTRRRTGSLEQYSGKKFKKKSSAKRLSLRSVEKSLNGSPIECASPSASSTPVHGQSTSPNRSSVDIPKGTGDGSDSTSVIKTSKKKSSFRRLTRFQMFRTKLLKPEQELTWQEKIDDIHKLIYKQKHRDKYLTCPSKISVDGKDGYPGPKLTLHLHPYGLEEDENKNITLEVAIEQPKKHRLHSKAKLRIHVSAEEDKNRKCLGKVYDDAVEARLSFFYVKRFISHEELKQSKSETVIINIKVEMILPM